MRERLFTPIIKNREGARLWLCGSLSNVGLRLAGDYEAGGAVAEFNASSGLGGVATSIVFRERSDGSELNWCGIPFHGDVVDVVFPGGEQVTYSSEELEEWATPHLQQRITEHPHSV
jgi:hypothetical protein